jgi:hypothetical protein
MTHSSPIQYSSPVFSEMSHSSAMKQIREQPVKGMFSSAVEARDLQQLSISIRDNIPQKEPFSVTYKKEGECDGYCS